MFTNKQEKGYSIVSLLVVIIVVVEQVLERGEGWLNSVGLPVDLVEFGPCGGFCREEFRVARRLAERIDGRAISSVIV